jgi:hypothetical protein
MDYVGAYALASDSAIHVLAESSENVLYDDFRHVASVCFESIGGIRFLVYPEWARDYPETSGDGIVTVGSSWFAKYEEHPLEKLMRNVLFQCVHLLLEDGCMLVQDLISICDVCAKTVAAQLPRCEVGNGSVPGVRQDKPR